MPTAKDVNVRFNCKKDICLVTGIVADNGVPTLATHGVAMYETETMAQASSLFENGANFPRHPITRHRLVKGGVTPEAILVLWGYTKSADVWSPIILNAGADAFATYDAFTVLLEGLSHFDRVYLQVDWTAGTIEAWLTACSETF